MDDPRPIVALTLGDVAGIGPEVVARAWGEGALLELARPFVIGDAEVMSRAAARVALAAEVISIGAPEEAEPSARVVPCLEVDGAGPGLASLAIGRVDGRAGRAAHEFLVAAIELALAGRVDAIVTLPLNKVALALAGIAHPGHTEILAERCGVGDDFAMMLYLGPPPGTDGPGLGVVHATLHVALREVFELLTIDRVRATIGLADRAMRPLTGGRPPRIGVAGLNPHAGEGGLFGTEEIRTIAPAVAMARSDNIGVEGPLPADTLFARGVGGEFDAIVAMYHDQGHVAIKTLGFDRAVNVTLGLPIVRTSVAHGTAFDLAGTGRARATGLVEAVRVAARLATARGVGIGR